MIINSVLIVAERWKGNDKMASLYIDLKIIIEESRGIARAFNELADRLEQVGNNAGTDAGSEYYTRGYNDAMKDVGREQE